MPTEVLDHQGILRKSPDFYQYCSPGFLRSLARQRRKKHNINLTKHRRAITTTTL